MFRTRLGVSIVMTFFTLLVIAIISSFIFSDALGVLLCFLPISLLFVFPIVYFFISPFVYFDPLSDNKPPTQESLRVAENIHEWLDDDEELLAFTVGTLKSFPSIQILALTNKCLRIGADVGDRDIEVSKIAEVSWSPITSVLRIDLSIPPSKLEFKIIGREWKRRAHEFSSAWNKKGEKVTKNVGELIRLLRSRNSRNQIYALQELGDTQDPRAVEALIEIVEDTDSGLQDRAAETLGKIKSPEAVDALICAVQDPIDWRLQEYSAWALGEIGDPRAGDAILPLLQSDVGEVIDAARHALAKLGDRRIIPRLLADLFHHEEQVRCSSAKLLGDIGAETSIPHLEKLAATHRNVQHEFDVRRTAREAIERIRQRTSDPERQYVERLLAKAMKPATAWDAAKTLGKIKEPYVVDALIKALKDENKIVKASSVWALGEIGDKRASEPLTKLLRDPDCKVRGGAALALRNCATEQAFEPLLDALYDDEEYVSTNAAAALGNLGDPRAVEPLMHTVRTSDNRTASCAVGALGNLGDGRSFELLLSALGGKFGEGARVSAANAIGKLGNRQAISPLLKALQDDSVNMRISAVAGLGYLGDPDALPALEEAIQNDDGEDELGCTVKDTATKAMNRIQAKSDMRSKNV